MDRRTRRASLRAAVCSARLRCLAHRAAPRRSTDLDDWNLTETTSTWGGGTQFHISSGGDGSAAFRWLDSPNKTTVISANTCTDVSLLGSATRSASTTRTTTTCSPARPGACFVLRGRTAIGSGSMVNHDGRIKR